MIWPNMVLSNPLQFVKCLFLFLLVKGPHIIDMSPETRFVEYTYLLSHGAKHAYLQCICVCKYIH